MDGHRAAAATATGRIICLCQLLHEYCNDTIHIVCALNKAWGRKGKTSNKTLITYKVVSLTAAPAKSVLNMSMYCTCVEQEK